MNEQVLAKLEQQYLTFGVLEDVFALGTEYIREIVEYSRVTAVPLMPDFVHGVCNLRGDVVPVVDMAIRFGKGRCNVGRCSCIVILDIPFQGKIATLGALVDWVEDVVELDDVNIEPAPSFGAKLQSHFIRGVAQVSDRLVILLKAEKVLSINEMSALINKMSNF